MEAIILVAIVLLGPFLQSAADVLTRSPKSQDDVQLDDEIEARYRKLGGQFDEE